MAQFEFDFKSFVLGVLVVLILVILWKKKDFFTNNELKNVIKQSTEYNWDYVKFVAKLGSTDVSPLDFERLLSLYKKGKWNNKDVNLILSGKGYLV